MQKVERGLRSVSEKKIAWRWVPEAHIERKRRSGEAIRTKRGTAGAVWDPGIVFQETGWVSGIAGEKHSERDEDFF